ncbi:MAG TPA: protein-disulfide reductase DsbD domain-containing protein [Candidatus Saccharimonadales bacterium]|nr:protein-disulfide reductase DsbD domain-containing protein [Candidatus Saccharimonadales bacterium]
MRTILKLLPIVFLTLAGNLARAAHTQVQLLLSAETARPGDTIWAGVDLKMDSGWHTYWENPGEAGMATKIEWQLPTGVAAGETQWPLPEKLPPAEVTTYGYNNEVMLLVPLKLATDLKPGQLDLKANVSWLECKEECVPGSATVEAALNIGPETKVSVNAKTIDLWKSKTPQSGSSLQARAWWEKPANGDKRPLILEWSAPDKSSQSDFFPSANDNYDIQPATEVLSAKPGEVRLRKTVQKFSGDWPEEISGVIVMDIGIQRQGFDVKMSVGDKIPAGETPSAPSESNTGVSAASLNSSATQAAGTAPLPLMLLYAFIGGLILNIMPCVLPVIALKILGFINHAQHEPRRVRALGLIYAAGVLVSFLVLAAVVIGVKAAGHHAGWGMQFGSPVFIVVLTTLIVLVALNLFGVFEVTLGGRTLSAAGQLAARQGAPGAFFNGLLAAALATPCTAPFLAPALGFAFAQSASLILLIFLFVGLGLAAPYVVLSWNPVWLKFLPKPGAWMEKFKIAMGFPMLATAIWLFNLAYDYYGKNVLWLGVFLVAVAFAAWIFGEFVQRGRAGKSIALVIVLILLIGSYAYALEDQLHWRTPTIVASGTGSLSESQGGIDWQPWSPQAVATARSEGRPVLVDFTADWCLTCQVNKKIAIEVSSVQQKLKEINAVALVGDYTHFPDNITAELNRYGRAGVPLVLVYPKGIDAQPIVLPEVLTPGIVLNALDRAAK